MKKKSNILTVLEEQNLLKTINWESAPGAEVFKLGTAGVGPLINVNQDLHLKEGCTINSWWAGGYFIIKGQVHGYIYNVLYANTPMGSMLVENLSMTNATTGVHYGDSKTYPVEGSVVISPNELNIVTPTGSIKGDFNDLHAIGIMEGCKFEVHLKAASPAIFNGGTGIFPHASMDVRQYSLPVLATKGTVTFGDETYEFKGNSWFDRQWGNKDPDAQGKWTWFGISLTSGEAISAWFGFDATIGKNRSFASILHIDGSQTIAASNFIPDPKSEWKSPETGNIYPLKWTLEIPHLNSSLLIESTIDDQEFTMPIFGGGYEGVSKVTGTFQGKSVIGNARLELLG